MTLAEITEWLKVGLPLDQVFALEDWTCDAGHIALREWNTMINLFPFCKALLED